MNVFWDAAKDGNRRVLVELALHLRMLGIEVHSCSESHLVHSFFSFCTGACLFGLAPLHIVASPFFFVLVYYMLSESWRAAAAVNIFVIYIYIYISIYIYIREVVRTGGELASQRTKPRRQCSTDQRRRKRTCTSVYAPRSNSRKAHSLLLPITTHQRPWKTAATKGVISTVVIAPARSTEVVWAVVF